MVDGERWRHWDPQCSDSGPKQLSLDMVVERPELQKPVQLRQSLRSLHEEVLAWAATADRVDADSRTTTGNEPAGHQS